MSRTLRFRAWDKREHVMWTPIINEKGKPCSCDPLTGILFEFEGALIDPVMQWTGHQDADGKDLYEGDIYKHDDLDGIYIVEWNNEAASFGTKKSEYGVVDAIIPPLGNKNRIIGNIYQNPELL